MSERVINDRICYVPDEIGVLENAAVWVRVHNAGYSTPAVITLPEEVLTTALAMLRASKDNAERRASE